MLINAWVATVQCCSVASVRKRLQASGIERGRSSVQEYMKAELWPAKQVICVEILVFLCLSYFFGPPTGEESALDGAEQAAAPGVVHIGVAVPWQSEEAFGVLFLQDTHFSRLPRHFSLRSFPFCRRTSRRSLSYSLTHFHHSFSFCFGEVCGVCSFVSRCSLSC